MQFKHPEILGFLLFLAVPVLIHLFQLQRFKKEDFTNIKFLKEIEASSKKRKKLKDLLILICRLLALTGLILAFAQPYNKRKLTGKEKEVVLYVDNSFSMQARGQNGVELFQALKSELLENLDQKACTYHLITNDGIYSDLDLEQLKKEVLRLRYGPSAKSMDQVILESEQIKRINPSKEIETYLLSDFSNTASIPDSAYDLSSSSYHLVRYRPTDDLNISLDSVWIDPENSQGKLLKTRLVSYGMQEENLSVSLTLEGELYGKASLNLEPGEEKLVEFSLPENSFGRGIVEINDHRKFFDNQLYFMLQENETKDVLVLGKDEEFLRRIYRPSDFGVLFFSEGQEDQGLLQDQDLIILNGYSELNAPLAKSLEEFARNKGNLVIIPPKDVDQDNFNKVLVYFGLGGVERLFSIEKEVTYIAYEHPFFENVFKEKVLNFQYPKVFSGLRYDLARSSTLLGYSDGSAFLSEIPYYEHNIYVFSASLNDEGTNFSRSPLIVPVFYNFAHDEKNLSSLYRVIGNKNEIRLQLDAPSKEAARLMKGTSEYIPLQSQRDNLLEITTEDFPEEAGHYEVLLAEKKIATVAFNHSREENVTNGKGFEMVQQALPEAEFIDSAKKAFRSINVMHKGSSLWQYFITFALVFLIMEMLIQKFFKG